jgi:hypothetical protein
VAAVCCYKLEVRFVCVFSFELGDLRLTVVKMHARQADIEAREKMNYERIFVLGVGAQKSGTSWLHSYVSNSKNANMGFSKEYHIWDAVSSPLLLKSKVVGVRDLLRMNYRTHMRYGMQNIPFFYEAYFRSIYMRGAKITGDITPSYAVLSVKDLISLKKKIERTGAKVRCVYLMRDPFERCWSAVRMEPRNNRKKFDDEVVLQKMYATEQYKFRTRYEITCENLLSVFTDHELYFGFYETMFSDSEIQRLSSFLGIPANYAHRETQVNVSVKSQNVGRQLRAEIIDFYSDTYGYCLEKFPITSQIWNSS